MQEWLLQLVRATNPRWPFRSLNRLPYALCIALVRRVFRGDRQIRAVYIKHDLDLYEWVPGSSDVDLCVIIESLGADEELRLLERFWRRYELLHRLFPFALVYSEGPVPVASIADLSRAGFRRAATGLGIVPPEQWRLLCGGDVRAHIPAPDETDHRDLANPVFHALFRSHFVSPQLADPIPEGRYLRKYHRLLTKACQFVSANDSGAAAGEGSGPDAHAAVDAFAPLRDDDATRSLPELLGALRDDNYFARDRAVAERLTGELTFGFFRLVTRYYRNLPERSSRLASPDRGGDTSLAPIPAEIRALVAAAPAKLRQCCRAILCSPTAPLLPRPEGGAAVQRHEVQLIVPDEIAPDDFRAVMEDARKLQRAGDFRRTGEIHLLSESMFDAQESRLGARFAFHGAHLRRTGSVLHGADLIDRVRLPDEATLTRAVRERVAELRIRRLSFWTSGRYVGSPRRRLQRFLFELMSYRLFLEGGVILTSSAEIRAAYLDRFEGGATVSTVRAVLGSESDEKLTRTDVRDHARLGHALCHAIQENGRKRR